LPQTTTLPRGNARAQDDERKEDERVESGRSGLALRNTKSAANDRARWIGFSEDDGNLALKAQLLWHRVGDNAFHLERPAKVLEPVQTFFDHVKARRVTESHGAIVAKGSTGYYSDIRFAQQTIGEILGGEPELADVD